MKRLLALVVPFGLLVACVPPQPAEDPTTTTTASASDAPKPEPAPAAPPAAAPAAKGAKVVLSPAKATTDAIKDALAADGWSYTSMVGDPGKCNITVGLEKGKSRAIVSVTTKGGDPELAKKKGRAVSEPDGKCVFEVDANGDAATSKHILDVLTGK